MSHTLEPFLCHKLSHLLGSPPLKRDVFYGRPLTLNDTNIKNYTIILLSLTP